MRIRSPAFGVILLLVSLIGGIGLLLRPTGLPQPSFQQRVKRATALNVPIDQLFEPGEDPLGESALLLSQGAYWYHRLAYPTGRFDARWLHEAQRTDQLIQTGLPAGSLNHNLDSPIPLTLDPTQFTSLGPAPQNSPGYGHVGGRTNVIAIDPVQTTVAYFGSDGGGVWKTTNCCTPATTWIPVTDDPLLTTIAIGDIVIDPNDHNTVYAGTGDLRFGSFSFGSAGVLKSSDQGITWTVIGADVFNGIYDQPAGVYPQYQAIGKVRVDPRNSNNLIVGTKTGLYFSYDAGTNWTGPCFTNSFANQRQDITGLLVSDNGTGTDLYAAVGTRGFNTTVQPDLDQNGANGIYKATVPASGCPAAWNLITRADNGWPAGTGSGAPYPSNSLGRIDLAIAPSNPNIIYAQVANIPTRGQLGVWRTIDGGLNWEQRSDVNGLTGCFGDWPQNWYDQGLAVDPNDPNTLYMSTVDVWRSTNGAATFTNLSCGYAGGNVHVDHHALAYVGNDSSQLLAGSDGGVYLTTNANTGNPNTVSFSQLNSSISTIEFYSGDITAYFAYDDTPGINAGAQDNGSSVYVWNNETPGPAIWQMQSGGDGMFARIEPILGQRWYQESQWGNLRLSTTGPYGNYSTSARGGWYNNPADRVSFIMPYEIYKYNCPATGCGHLVAGSQRVWETVQGGLPSSSWYINSPDLTKNSLADRSFINQLSFAVNDESIVIAGTSDGNVQYGFNLGQGSANSATWIDITGGNAVLPNRPIMDVTTDPLIPTIGYAAVGGFDENTPTTPGHVYQVTCNATCSSFTWVNKSGNLPNIPVNSIVANPNLPAQLFVGTDWGLYFTDDIIAAAPVWQKFTAGLPSVMIWDMAIDHGFSTLALFTRSRGAYVWPLPGSTPPPIADDLFLPFVSR